MLIECGYPFPTVNGFFSAVLKLQGHVEFVVICRMDQISAMKEGSTSSISKKRQARSFEIIETSSSSATASRHKLNMDE
jgi:hypothetical protein